VKIENQPPRRINAMRKLTSALLQLTAGLLLPLLLAGCSAKARMARHERRADSYFAAGDFSKAEVEYLNTLRLVPSNAHAYVRLGTIYFQQGRFSRAYAFLNKGAELAPQDLDVRLKLGSIYLGAQKTKQAREEANAVLGKSPTNSEAVVLLAESADSQKELENARRQLENLSKQAGDASSLQLGFGVLDFKAGDLKSAETAIKRSITLDSKSSAAYFALGSLYAAQNNFKDAETAIKTAAELSPPRSMRRLSYATFKIQRGDLAQGKQLLAEISKQTPDFIPAWIQQAEIALAEKKFEDCSSLLDQALARDPDNYQALSLRGRSYLAQGLNDKAVAELEHAVAVYDSSAQFQYLLAFAYSQKNDLKAAVVGLTKALSLTPDFPEAILALANVNIRRGNAEAAVTSLTQFVKQHPRVAQGYALLATAYLAQGDLDRALGIYSQMAEVVPKNPEVPLVMGTLLLQQNKSAEARQAFERALTLSPHLPPAVEQLVDLDIGEKRFPAALDRINEEFGTTSKAPERELLMAKVYVARAMQSVGAEAKTDASTAPLAAAAAQTDVNLAQAALLRAIDLNSNLPTGYLMLAQLYVSAGKQQAALDRLESLVAKTNSAAAYVQIGMIQDAMKNYKAARDAYEKALESAPDMSVPLNNLAYLYSEYLGDLDKAYAYAEKAHRLLPNQPSTTDTLGWILYKKGDYAGAVVLLTESASKMPGDAEAQSHLGMVEYMLGQEDAARSALQFAAKSPKAFPGKDEVAAKLAVLTLDENTADAKSVANLEKNLADNPNDPVVASRLGAIYERKGQLDKAVQSYERMLKQNPQDVRVMGRLAKLYLRLGDSQKALEIAKQAHVVAPNDPAISALLGRSVFLAGDHKWADNLLEDAARQLPNQPELLYYLAWAHYSVGRLNDAESAMKAAQPSLSSTNLTDAKRFLALITAAKTKNPAQTAVTQANEILSAESDYVPALMVSALNQQQGNSDQAVKTYERILTRFPYFTPAVRNLALLYAQQPANEQRAFELANKARNSLPDDAELARVLGILSYKRGDYNRSAQLLGESAQKLSDDSEQLFYLGMSRYQLKQKQGSKDALSRALTLNLPAPLASEARKVLDQLK
jgi:tetratricopeptide (TPR) repeat protein